MECSNLRAQIDRVRRRNVRGEEYIPDLLLLPLISHKAVRNELVQKVKPYFVDELTTTIVASAQKVFAILVVIDQVGLVKDLLERHLEDSNLPLPLRIQASLEESVAISFSRAQWMFLAPKFSRSMLSKQLAPECILPFATEEKIDQGELSGRQPTKQWLQMTLILSLSKDAPPQLSDVLTTASS